MSDLPADAQRALWAVRVLDAWAKKHEVMSPAPSYHRHRHVPRGGRWRIFHGVYAVGGYYSTADSARIAAAERLVAEDPKLVEEVT